MLVDSQTKSSNLRDALQIHDGTVDRRIVNLEVAGVHDDANRRANREHERIRDGVVHMDELHGEAAAADGFARLDHMQLTAFGQTRNAVVELILEQLDGHASAVNRCTEFAHQIRQTADVILVSVGDKNATHAVAVLKHIGEIRNDGVNARHGFIRKNLTAVHDDDVVAVFIRGHVLADFAHAAQRNHAQGGAAGMLAGAGTHRRRLLADPLQRLRDAGLFFLHNRGHDAAASALTRAHGFRRTVGCRLLRARRGVILAGRAGAHARRVAARLNRILRCCRLLLRGRGGCRLLILRRRLDRTAGVLASCGTRTVIGARCAGIRVFRRHGGFGSGGRRRSARHARTARLFLYGCLSAFLRGLLCCRLARLSGGARSLTLRGALTLGVDAGTARHRAAARRALLRAVLILILRLILVSLTGNRLLVQFFVFVFCHKNFLSVMAQAFLCASSNRRSPLGRRSCFILLCFALPEVIPTAQSILNEAAGGVVQKSITFLLYTKTARLQLP